MSTQALGGVGSAVPPSELAATQRVQQLQALIESARQVAAGGVLASATASTAATPSATTPSATTPSSGTTFASALQAATDADTAGASSAAAGTEPAALPTTGASGEAGDQYEALVDQAATRNGLDPAVLHGLIQQESGFDPSAGSSAGAQGLTQLMPGTASSLGVADPLNPAEAIEGGARYLSEMLGKFGGNTEDALAAYNAGPGAVQQYGGVPPYAETQSYVSKVLGYAETYRQSHPTSTTGALA